MGLRKLRDAVHGDIHLADAEFAVLDTAQVQRLRGIKQLGAACYVYPGAQHTRFEHCLGACWLARRILSQVEASGHRVPPVEKQAVLLAALAHDVTHIPFGHTFEDERRLLDRHDESPRRYELLLRSGELGELLLSSEAGRLALEMLRPGAQPPAGRPYLREVVSGTICADLLDYLKRDNYFCGLRYEFDERLFDYFRIVDGHLALDLYRAGLLRRDALTEITNLLRIRYVLSERVYYHHAKMAAGVMVSKAVESAFAEGLVEEDLCALTDGGLLHSLRGRFGSRPAVVELLDDFERRRLFKRCYLLTREIGEDNVVTAVSCYHHNEGGRRDADEQRIAEALGIERHRVAIYCAPPGMALKEADVPVTVPREGLAKLSDLNSEEIRVLKAQHRALWKLYVFISPRAGDVPAGPVCEEVIGFPNELQRQRHGGLA
jgi:HD superfamily phosphohydrolase